MTDIASLGLKVDSSQVATATDKLDEFVDSAGRAEDAAGSVGEKLSESGKKFDGFSDTLDDAKDGADGLAPSLRGISSSAALTVIGITAAAASAAVLVKAYIEGARESETFAKAIALTGNAAGVTIGQLQVMAQELDDIRGTQAAATAALSEFVATGKIASEDLLRFAKLGQDLERDLGIPIKETAAQFASLAEKPSAAAAKLQKSINFLTPAVYDLIRAHEKAGDVIGAARIAEESLAAAQERQLAGFEENVPLIVRGWRAIKDGAAEAWDAMLGLGRPESPEAALKRLQETRGDRALGQIRLGPNGDIHGRGDAQAIRLADEEEKRLAPIVALRKQQADAIAAVKKETDAYIESQQELAGKEDEFIDAQKRINQAWSSFNLAEIDRSLSGVVGKFDNANDELEALHAASLVSDEKYFARRIELIQKSADAEIRALQQMNVVLSKQDDLSAVERIAAQNKIAENEQRIINLRARAASQTSVISIQETKALRDTANAYADAQASADRYVETLIKRFEIESKGLGLGDQERQRLRERADLEARFEDRRQQLDRDLRRKDITKAQFDQLLKIEEDALKKSEAAYDEHYKELLKKQGDWKTGASEAFRNFLDEAQNVAKGIEEALTRGFDGALDSLVNFVMTGKGNFSDLINSIIADLLRVELKVLLSKVLEPIFGGLGGILGGGGLGGLGGFDGSFGIGDIFKNFGGGRATGGPVNAGMGYVINENTAKSELFYPSVDGYVSPASTATAGGGTHLHITYNVAPGASVGQFQAWAEQHSKQIKAEINEDRRRGRRGS